MLPNFETGPGGVENEETRMCVLSYIASRERLETLESGLMTRLSETVSLEFERKKKRRKDCYD